MYPPFLDAAGKGQLCVSIRIWPAVSLFSQTYNSCVYIKKKKIRGIEEEGRTDVYRELMERKGACLLESCSCLERDGYVFILYSAGYRKESPPFTDNQQEHRQQPAVVRSI